MRALPAAPSLGNPMLEELGVELVQWRPGYCEMALPLAPRHLNRRGRVQGGVAATLLDAACGYAGLLSAADDAVADAATITLSVSYLRKLEQGRVRVIGRVTGEGRSIYFSSGELFAPDGNLAATAIGSFKKSTTTLAGGTPC